MSGAFELPADLADDVDIVYLDDDDDLDNLEDNVPEVDGDIDDDIEPVEDKSQLTFDGHTRSVFCIDVSNNNQLAATGGEDDNAFVWNLSTGEVVLECTGHTDSVITASFSYDDKYVVTADMGGMIQVWDLLTKKLHWCYEGDEIEWLIWHPATHVIISGVQSGEIYMWQIPQANYPQGNCKVFPTSGSKCICGVILPNGTQLVAGYEDGTVKIWDLKSASIVHQLAADDSNDRLTNIKLSSDGKLLLLCGSTNGALVVKTSDCKIAASLKAGGSDEIETAAFCPENDLPIVATGNLNGDICLWDIRRQALRHKISIGYCVTQMLWGPNAMLFAGSVDGAVYVYSGRNGQLLTTITGHESAILNMEFTKDFKLLLTTSDDTNAKVFDVQKCCMVTQS